MTDHLNTERQLRLAVISKNQERRNWMCCWSKYNSFDRVSWGSSWVSKALVNVCCLARGASTIIGTGATSN